MTTSEPTAAERELADIAAAIGTVEFMDLPDGGDVTLAEQVGRMRAALAEARRERDEATRKRIFTHERWIAVADEAERQRQRADAAEAASTAEKSRADTAEAEVARLGRLIDADAAFAEAQQLEEFLNLVNAPLRDDTIACVKKEQAE